MTKSFWVKFQHNWIAIATALLLGNSTVASAEEALPPLADLLLPHQLPQTQAENKIIPEPIPLLGSLIALVLGSMSGKAISS